MSEIRDKESDQSIPKSVFGCFLLVGIIVAGVVGIGISTRGVQKIDTVPKSSADVIRDKTQRQVEAATGAIVDIDDLLENDEKEKPVKKPQDLNAKEE